jgi:acyl-CoA thioesterase
MRWQGMSQQQLNDQTVHRNYYKEIYETLKNEPYANFLGIELVELGEGTAKATLELKEHMLNAHGTAHGAIIFAIADYVFACASNSYGKTSVGLSTTVNFMAPGIMGHQLIATAKEVKRNNRTAWYLIEVESNGELIATMDALVYRKNEYFVPIEK